MTTHAEIERKYDVDESAVVPGLDDIAAVEYRGEVGLDAEYFDTEAGDLAAHRIVLRRRRGGEDEGWHIKIPADDHRMEYHWPLTDRDATGKDATGKDATGKDAPDNDAPDNDAPDNDAPEKNVDREDVPAEVLDPVLVHVRDRGLRVIARVHTQRTIVRLVGDDGGQLIEFVDDVVTASDVGTGILRTWREWEIEVLDGAPDSAQERDALLDAVEERLIAAGATPSASRSKLASALGRASLAEEHRPVKLDRKSSASDVLIVAVVALVDELKLLDPSVRANEPDSVHQLRTRTRRLRSLFASYRSVFDRAVTDPIRDELQQLGAVLGEARDAEVMRDRARALADHERVASPIADRLVGDWDRAYSAAHDRVLAELSGDRYLRLLDSLDEFVELPALADHAPDKARKVVPAALAKDLARVLRRAKESRAATSEQERFTLLHETRKAAKRLRYAAEAVSRGRAAIFGKRVRRMAAAAEAVHDLLGEYRDSTLMQHHLKEAAVSGDQAFDYGVLHEVERLSAALCLAEYPAAVSKLKSFR